MKKILLIMLPVLGLSAVGIAQTGFFGVREVGENLYEVDVKTSITTADQQQLLGLLKQAYGLDDLDGDVKLAMMPAAAGDVIVLDQTAAQDLIPQRSIGIYKGAQMLTPEAAAINEILRKYAN